MDHPMGPQCHYMYPYKRDTEEDLSQIHRGEGGVKAGRDWSDMGTSQGMLVATEAGGGSERGLPSRLWREYGNSNPLLVHFWL